MEWVHLSPEEKSKEVRRIHEAVYKALKTYGVVSDQRIDDKVWELALLSASSMRKKV